MSGGPVKYQSGSSAGLVAVVFACSLTLLAGCSGSDNSSAPIPRTVSSAPKDVSTDVGQPAPASTGSAGSGQSADSREPGSSDSSAGSSRGHGGSSSAKAAVAPLGNKGTKTVAFSAAPTLKVDGSRLKIEVTRVQKSKTKGSGPGVVNGPGVVIQIKVTNRAAKSASLAAFAPTLFYGAEATPATTATSDPRNKPVPSSVGAGKSVTGTYVFTVPGSTAGALSVSVLVDVAAPTVVFTNSGK